MASPRSTVRNFVPLAAPTAAMAARAAGVWAVADRNINTLVDYRFFKNGMKRAAVKMVEVPTAMAKGQDDILLRMPVGTTISDRNSDEILADLTEHGQMELLAKGGEGGWGNISLQDIDQTARRVRKTEGKVGERRELQLELKVLADVGLLGMPNAGQVYLHHGGIQCAPLKSRIIRSQHWHPILASCAWAVKRVFVIADIPGLIEGAAEGAGLGHQFSAPPATHWPALAYHRYGAV